MSELDAAIESLRSNIIFFSVFKGGANKEQDSCRVAIRILEEFPKWERLIEAAGKIDKETALRAYIEPPVIYDENHQIKDIDLETADLIYALIQSLPDKEKKE